METKRIQPLEILLTTYNGELYLSELMESVLNQTHGNWRLLIRDDRSSDGTIEILERYAHRHPDKIHLVEKGCQNIGVSLSFSRLIERSQSNHVMFCDQDDVWLPDKIARTYREMIGAEKTYGTQTPLLVHTDMKVTDQDLRVLSDSFWGYQGLDPEKGKSFNRALLYNVVTGCTAMANRRLCDLAVPIPAQAVMYDWWLSLVASAFGRIVHIENPTVLYRQHGRNVIGAKPWNLSVILRKMLAFLDTREFRNNLSKSQDQALVFSARYRGSLSSPDSLRAEVYATLRSQSLLKRRISLVRHRLFTAGIARNISLFLRV